MKNSIDDEVIKQYGNTAKSILKILSSEKNQIMSENETKAFSETYDIIMNMNYSVRKRIPDTFMEMLLRKRDKNLNVNIDYTRNILEQITDETKIILAIIYKKYLLNMNENIVNEDKNILKNKNVYQQNLEHTENKENAIVEYKKSNFLKKIFNQIKCWLKK